MRPCTSCKTDSRPLERKPMVSLMNLMRNVIMGSRDEDTVTSLANRLARLNNQLTDKEKQTFTEYAGGKPISDCIHDLFNAYDPDKNIERAQKKFRMPVDAEPTNEQMKSIQEEMAFEASKIFENPRLREFIDNAKRDHEQIIDGVNLDTVTFSGFDGQAKEKASKIIQEWGYPLDSALRNM